jgi:hypothetical protein
MADLIEGEGGNGISWKVRQNGVVRRTDQRVRKTEKMRRVLRRSSCRKMDWMYFKQADRKTHESKALALQRRQLKCTNAR